MYNWVFLRILFQKALAKIPIEVFARFTKYRMSALQLIIRDLINREIRDSPLRVFPDRDDVVAIPFRVKRVPPTDWQTRCSDFRKKSIGVQLH